MESQISDIFHSLQGELPLLGVPMTFVRMAGCNRSCGLCDEAAARRSWAKHNTAHVLNSLTAEWLCISGGEPLMQHEFVLDLAKQVKKEGHKIELDTNGDYLITCVRQYGPKAFDDLDCIVISPKFTQAELGSFDERMDELNLMFSEDDRAHVRLLISDSVYLYLKDNPIQHWGWNNPIIFSAAYGSGVKWPMLQEVLPEKNAKIGFQVHRLAGFK